MTFKTAAHYYAFQSEIIEQLIHISITDTLCTCRCNKKVIHHYISMVLTTHSGRVYTRNIERFHHMANSVKLW